MRLTLLQRLLQFSRGWQFTPEGDRIIIQKEEGIRPDGKPYISRITQIVLATEEIISEPTYNPNRKLSMKYCGSRWYL